VFAEKQWHRQTDRQSWFQPTAYRTLLQKHHRPRSNHRLKKLVKTRLLTKE
jgi:hypothetical protein